MAKAANLPSAEGKTIDVTSERMCDVCENEEAIKYCLKCPGSLCAVCTTSHLRVKMTKDHTLCDIKDVLNAEESKTKLSKCPKHLNKTLECYCRDCGCFICEDCKEDHQDHIVLSSEEEEVLYQTAYHNHMKRLMENVYDLQCYKKILDETIKSYEEASDMVHEWEDELITYIRDSAKQLKQELTNVKTELEAMIHNKQNGIKAEINATEQIIKRLRDASNVTEPGILSSEVHSAEVLLKRLALYKAKVISRTRVPSNKELLSHHNKKGSVKVAMKILFTLNKPISSPIDVTTWRQIISNNEEIISNPRGEQGYRFCKSPLMDNIIIHGKSAQDIRVLDTDFKTIRHAICNFLIWKMTSVYSDEHIVLHEAGKKLSLLDGNLKVVETIPIKGGSIRAISYLSPHHFIRCDIRNENVYLCFMAVENQTMVMQGEMELHGIEDPWYMVYDHFNDNLSLCSHEIMHKFWNNYSQRSKHTLQGLLPSKMWCTEADNYGNLLIGDMQGNIHLFDKSVKSKVVTKLNSSIRDVYLKNGRLLVSTCNNKLHAFIHRQ